MSRFWLSWPSCTQLLLQKSTFSPRFTPALERFASKNSKSDYFLFFDSYQPGSFSFIKWTVWTKFELKMIIGETPPFWTKQRCNNGKLHRRELDCLIAMICGAPSANTDPLFGLCSTLDRSIAWNCKALNLSRPFQDSQSVKHFFRLIFHKPINYVSGIWPLFSKIPDSLRWRKRMSETLSRKWHLSRKTVDAISVKMESHQSSWKGHFFPNSNSSLKSRRVAEAKVKKRKVHRGMEARSQTLVSPGICKLCDWRADGKDQAKQTTEQCYLSINGKRIM